MLITEHTYFIVTPTQCKTTCIQMYKKGASPYRVIPTLIERSRRGEKETGTVSSSHFTLFQPSGWIAVSLHSHSWPPHRHITVQWPMWALLLRVAWMVFRCWCAQMSASTVLVICRYNAARLNPGKSRAALKTQMICALVPLPLSYRWII